jgi:hypothetical protein
MNNDRVATTVSPVCSCDSEVGLNESFGKIWRIVGLFIHQSGVVDMVENMAYLDPHFFSELGRILRVRSRYQYACIGKKYSLRTRGQTLNVVGIVGEFTSE